jgi:hypothetical protein
MSKILASALALSALLGLALFGGLPASAAEPKPSGAHRVEKKSEKAKYFIDVHDRRNGTFPAKISKEELAGFFAKYEAACREEGVTLLRLHVSLEEGKAYCFTSARSADAVKKAHERVGLPFDGITEVNTVTPGDLYLP